MGILAGILLLCVLIVIHEFGHFWVAKLLGVRVTTFSIGFGPKLLKFTKGETEYCLSAIPLGGYVKMLGDSPDEELSEEDKKRSFLGQPVWRKSLIALAGPLFNLILPLFLFFGILVGPKEVPLPVLGRVMVDKAGDRAGLKPGDRIVSIDGQAIATFPDLVREVSSHPGQELEFMVERDEGLHALAVTPDAEPTQNPLDEDGKIGRLGVMLAENPPVKTLHTGVFQAVQEAFVHTWDMTRLTLLSLWMLVTMQISPKELGGPLMIVGAASQAASQGLVYYLQLMALISVNLGILNLLPIPVLDGGHLLFFAIEGVTRRPVSTRVRQVFTQAGLFLLIALMTIAIMNDVIRFFG